MWSVSLSNRCRKSLRALFLPSASSKEEESLTHTQVTKVISNKKRAAVLPNIRELKHSPASDTITGATVDCSMYTKTSDKTNDSNSSSSWNSLWCCGVSPSYAEDCLEPIQRRLFTSSKPAPPIPDFVIMKQDIRPSSEHLLRQLEDDEDSTSSITVFEDDDSFWSIEPSSWQAGLRGVPAHMLPSGKRRGMMGLGQSSKHVLTKPLGMPRWSRVQRTLFLEETTARDETRHPPMYRKSQAVSISLSYVHSFIRSYVSFLCDQIIFKVIFAINHNTVDSIQSWQLKSPSGRCLRTFWLSAENQTTVLPLPWFDSNNSSAL